MYYVIYDSETVIYDENGKRVASCPTESEAREYIIDRLTSLKT